MKSENLQILKNNGLPVPEFIRLKITENPEDPDMRSLHCCQYAVRSSCSAEDSKEYSFAGQFKSFLNVDQADLRDRIRDVTDSIKNYDFNSCYEKQTIREAVVNDSEIIIQEMVHSQYSGVIFTSNPKGLLNEMVITVGEGPGSNVVDDAADCTTYYYNTTDRLYFRDNDLIILEDAAITALTDLARKIRDIFMADMDIEFAIDADRRIWILQARNITTLEKSSIVTLDSSNISESYPGITLPLSREFVHDMYYTVFKNSLGLICEGDPVLEELEPDFRTMVEFVNGRAYYRIDNFYNILQLVPFSDKLISIWQDSLGIRDKRVTNVKRKISSRKKIGYLIRLVKLLKKTPEEMKALNEYFQDNISRYREMVDSSATVEDLLDAYNIIKEDLGSKWGITLLNDLYAFIFTYLSHDKEKISGIRSIESLKPVRLMNDLVREYHAGKDSETFRKIFKQYIELYGDRCIGELKLETKTYRTNPELLYQYAESHDVSEISGRQEQSGLTGFEKRARTGISNRELSRMNRTRIYGIVRDIYIRIGEILADQGLLENSRDVFYLTRSQFGESRADIERIVAEQKQRCSNYNKLPYYTRLVFSGGVFDTAVCPDQVVITDPGNELAGTPTSNGEAVGEAVVITVADESIDTRGKIIVTESTDPGWAALVKNSAGIIAERGSLLSHTAIITRELHKPSVVNVRNAAAVIHTGDTVRISGYTGKIEILKRKEINATYGNHSAQ